MTWSSRTRRTLWWGELGAYFSALPPGFKWMAYKCPRYVVWIAILALSPFTFLYLVDDNYMGQISGRICRRIPFIHRDRGHRGRSVDKTKPRSNNYAPTQSYPSQQQQDVQAQNIASALIGGWRQTRATWYYDIYFAADGTFRAKSGSLAQPAYPAGLKILSSRTPGPVGGFSDGLRLWPLLAA